MYWAEFCVSCCAGRSYAQKCASCHTAFLPTRRAWICPVAIPPIYPPYTSAHTLPFRDLHQGCRLDHRKTNRAGRTSRAGAGAFMPFVWLARAVPYGRQIPFVVSRIYHFFLRLLNDDSFVPDTAYVPCAMCHVPCAGLNGYSFQYVPPQHIRKYRAQLTGRQCLVGCQMLMACK